MLVRVFAGLVLAYAALLRFDAVTLVHGPVTAPGWIRAIQDTRPDVSALRPGQMTWPRWEGRYISDPYTYLQYAREPRGFYDAHRREPVFVFATKLSLWLFDDQDLAVSWASAAFSVLAVWATFLLGRVAWSPAVGLLAALGMAVEMENITWGVGGWRDDAFTCAVLLTAHAALRLKRQPEMRNAIWLGVICGLACLTRITSLSFVVPVLAGAWWLLPATASGRRTLVGTAIGVCTLVLAPFLVNCWRVYGDPLYAINVHADVYREAEGQVVQASQTAGQYLTTTLQTRPMRTLDTFVQGMTSYPFLNKWGGFTVWHRRLPALLAALSLLGLVGWIWLPSGRWLLALLAVSLVPYAMTWKLIGDWRFTMHAYPLLLMAAAWVVVTGAQLAQPAWWRERWSRWPPRRWWAARGAVVGALAASVWLVMVSLPAAVARETLEGERVVTVIAGPRDRAFFLRGWEPPVTQGNVTARVSTNTTALVRLPSPVGQPYEVVLRLDPYPAPVGPAPLPQVRVFVDGQPGGRLDLTWNPERIGHYVLTMPVTRHRSVDVQLMVEAATGQPNRLRLWWAQVRLK